MGINPALSFAIKCPDDLIRFLFSSTLGVLLRVSKDRVGGEQAANEGDVLVVTKLDRLARSIHDLWQIVSRLENWKLLINKLYQ